MTRTQTSWRALGIIVAVAVTVLLTACTQPPDELEPLATLSITLDRPVEGLEARVAFDAAALAYLGAHAGDDVIAVAVEVEPGVVALGVIATEPVSGDLVTLEFETLGDARAEAEFVELVAVDRGGGRTPLPRDGIDLEFRHRIDLRTASVPARSGPIATREPVDACDIEFLPTFVEHELGDVVGSGTVDVIDALWALDIATGRHTTPTAHQRHHADVDGDCVVTVDDAIAIATKWADPNDTARVQVAPRSLRLAPNAEGTVLLHNAGGGGSGALAIVWVSAPAGVSTADITPAGAAGRAFRVFADESATGGHVLFTTPAAGSDAVDVTILRDGNASWRVEPQAVASSALVEQTPPARSLSIHNDGGASGSYSIDGEPAWARLERTSGSVAAGDEDEVVITFSACPSTATSDTATLTLTGDEADPVTITVSRICTVDPSPLWSATPTSLTFSGTVGGSAPATRDVTLRNDGDATGAFDVSTNRAWISVQPSGGSLEPGATRSLGVDVSACTAAGSSTGSVSISGSGGGTVNIGVTRTCSEPPPVLSVTPSSHTFGEVEVGTDSSTLSFQVTNTGGGTLSGTVSVSSPFHVVSGSSFSDLGADASPHVVQVRFSPTGDGAVSRSVQFASNGGNATRSVSGTGFTRPSAPRSLENVHITAPYPHQVTRREFPCGIAEGYGVLGTSAGPPVSGAPHHWVCVTFSPAPEMEWHEYGIVRRVPGSTSETFVGVVYLETENYIQSFVDTTAGGQPYEYGVYTEMPNGARSRTVWSGYATTPATSLTSYNLMYFNCAGLPELVSTPLASLKYVDPCPTGRHSITYAPRGNDPEPSLPVACNLTPNHTRVETRLHFYDVDWDTDFGQFHYPIHSGFSLDRQQQVERDATRGDGSSDVIGHRRVLASCTAYVGEQRSGITFSVTDRHVVGWLAPESEDVYGPPLLEWGFLIAW